MFRPVRFTVVTACVVIVSGCGASSLIGSAAPTEQPYRHRLINQLDLPSTRFDGWEVVDAAAPPDPGAQQADVSAVVPPECAPGSAAVEASDAALYGGSRWTGATGTGPGDERFDASLYSGNDAPLDAITKFVGLCPRVSFTTDGGPRTVENSAVIPEQGDFTAVSGYVAAIAAPPSGGSTTTMVGRSESMTLVVTFSNPGPPDGDRATQVWQVAADKFARTQ